jgi:hypothetical protein
MQHSYISNYFFTCYKKAIDVLLDLRYARMLRGIEIEKEIAGSITNNQILITLVFLYEMNSFQQS